MIELTDTSLFKSVTQIAKEQERLENRILGVGGNVVKKNIKKLVASTIKGSNRSSGQYKDKLVDAVRRSKPHDGEVKVHILGTQSKGSGTFRLRFFEFATKRYQKRVNGKTLKKKRFVGTLAKYNGFFQQGWNQARSETETKMQQAYDKYIEKAWNG
jgi:hypothetical protein